MEMTENNEKTFDEWSDEYMVCNEFAVAYKRANPNAVIKYGEIDEGDLHCYVYDPEKDRTLDPTLSQFSAYNPDKYQDDWFIGDKHPHVDEVAEFDDIVEFVRDFGGTNVLTEAEKEMI
jgi:hypothetical protein